jgi:hypothetical protein
MDLPTRSIESIVALIPQPLSLNAAVALPTQRNDTDAVYPRLSLCSKQISLTSHRLAPLRAGFIVFYRYLSQLPSLWSRVSDLHRNKLSRGGYECSRSVARVLESLLDRFRFLDELRIKGRSNDILAFFGFLKPENEPSVAQRLSGRSICLPTKVDQEAGRRNGMNRRALEKHLSDHGSFLNHHGSRPDVWVNPRTQSHAPIPRHTASKKATARGICTIFGIPAPLGSIRKNKRGSVRWVRCPVRS